MSNIMILMLICIGFFNTAKAQSVTDSLEAILETDIHDTIRVNVIEELIDINYTKSIDKSIYYAEKLLVLSEKLEEPIKMLQAHKMLGVSYVRKNYGIDTIMTSFNKALAIAEEHNEIGWEARVLSNIGLVYRKFGQRDTAFALLQRSLILAEEEDLKHESQIALSNLAVMLKYQGSYENAKAYYLRALILAEELDDPYSVGRMYNNLAALYTDQEKLDTALVYYQKSLEIKQVTGDEYGMVMALSNIGGLYTEIGDFKQADSYLLKGYDLAKRINDDYGLALNLGYLGYNALDQKMYREAVHYSEEGLAAIGENGDVGMKIDCYQLLSLSYEGAGNYKDALEYEKLFKVLNDSIFSVEKNEQIKDLEIQYEVAKKNTENQILKTKTENDQKIIRNRTLAAIGLILALIFAIGWGSFVYRSNQEKKKLNQVLENRVKERTTELQTTNKKLEQANYELRTFNYIASHDIKEPIRNIGNYVGLISRKLPADIKSNLEDYFSFIKRNTTQLYTLIEDFSNYTEMSRNQNKGTSDVDLNALTEGIIDHLDESVQKYNGKVIKDDLPTIKTHNSLLFATLKNLIENGLKYNQSEKPIVEINYRSKEIHHEIIVSDNGIGIDKEYHEQIFEMFKRLHHRGEYEGSGIGLAIVKLSVNKLGGDIELESEKDKGSRFIIQFPH